MDQQRWKKIKDIFNAALEVPASERNRFVCTASDGDRELESETIRLLMADEHAGSYLQSPPIPGNGLETPSSPSLVQVGDILCHRFRIDRPIGEGGMGHVFEAWDSVLRVRVALKAIRPEIANHPASLSRFRQEVLTARSISHPNVCRTFDIELERVGNSVTGVPQNLIFLTMEFLEGETLAERITRTGPLPKEEAIAISRQIACGLICAHDHGIVHGDIKPANVMLVRHGHPVSDPKYAPSTDLRVVITDFGLARIDPLFSRNGFSTATGSILAGGTLAYMAPEQLEGKTISTATDIYAFGLVLLEMVTGQRAFSSSNELAGIAQRLIQPVAVPPTLISALPTLWRNVIEGCLRSKPSERFKNVAEVNSVLEGPRAGFLMVNRTLLARSLAVPAWSFSRLSGAVGVLAIIMALFVGGLRLYQSRTDSKIASGALIYLPEVRNRTGEKSFDNLTRLIQGGMAQSAQVNLLDPGRVGDILQQMTKSPDIAIDPVTARDIAMRAGAVRVVFADVRGSKGDYELDIDIQQPDNTPLHYRNHWTERFAWHAAADSNTIPPELLTAIRMASNWIRHEVGESANDVATLDAPPEDVTTDNWQALAAYAKAETLSATGQKENALIALQNAVRIDPEFALAYARMGDLNVSLGRTQEGFRAYALALKTDFDRRLTRKELDRIRGIYASDSWDYQSAEAAFRDYTVYYQHDYLGWFYQALPLRRLGRTQEAITILQKAFALDPRRTFAPADLATCYLEIGDFISAEQWIEVLRQLNDSDDAALLDGIVEFLHGRYYDAENRFTFLLHSRVPSVQLKALSFLAHLAAERKEYAQSLAWINTGIMEAGKQGNDAQRAAFLMEGAFIDCHSGKYAACIQDSAQSLSMDQSPELLILASQLYGQSIAQTSGKTANEFRAALANLIRKVPNSSGSAAYTLGLHYVRTEVFIAKRNWKEALKEARRTATLDQQFSRREYLARALVLAARREPVPQKKQQLMEEARETYAQTALRPISIWAQPAMYPPGVYAEDLAAYIRISLDLGVGEADLRQSQKLYKALRVEEPPIRN
jgi:serine/threonine protein kinase/tetratricopeptide (TPR) repeat protein